MTTSDWLLPWRGRLIRLWEYVALGLLVWAFYHAWNLL